LAIKITGKRMIHDQWCVQEMGLTSSSVNAKARRASTGRALVT
jgi:hypothetical protein